MNPAEILKKAKAQGRSMPDYEKVVDALETALANLENVSNLLDQGVEFARHIRDEKEKAEARVRVLEGEATEAKDKIATLKSMLNGGEMQAAHTRGYLERVAEDDDVRESVVQTSTHEDARMVSPRQRRNYAGPMVADYDPGPGYVGAQYREDKEAMVSRMSGAARQPTWRDKPWSEW